MGGGTKCSKEGFKQEMFRKLYLTLLLSNSEIYMTKSPNFESGFDICLRYAA